MSPIPFTPPPVHAFAFPETGPQGALVVGQIVLVLGGTVWGAVAFDDKNAARFPSNPPGSYAGSFPPLMASKEFPWGAASGGFF